MVWWGNYGRDSSGRDMMDEAEWAINEFGTALLGDGHQTDRLIEAATVLGQRPVPRSPPRATIGRCTKEPTASLRTLWSRPRPSGRATSRRRGSGWRPFQGSSRCGTRPSWMSPATWRRMALARSGTGGSGGCWRTAPWPSRWKGCRWGCEPRRSGRAPSPRKERARRGASAPWLSGRATRG